MLKNRLIPVLLLQNGLLVRSEQFRIHQVIGAPIHEVLRFNEWNVDELIYLDITREDGYNLRRKDQKMCGLVGTESILDAVSKNCFMPLTWGGRIRTVDQMRDIFNRGADKITLNTAAFRTPDLIAESATAFGSQAIVVSIDVFCDTNKRREVYVDGGRTATGLDPVAWAQDVERLGAGEILLQSINRDGTGSGYDLDLIADVASATSVPLIACSGVGRYDDYAEGIKAGASAVAAANIWHFKELSDLGGKRALMNAGINVRF